MNRSVLIALAAAVGAFTAGASGADTLSCSLQPKSPGADVTAAKCRILQMHNDLRKKYGNAPLIWDDTLAEFAQGWADALVAFNAAGQTPPGALGVHSGNSCYANTNNGNAYGENISSGGTTAASAVQLWLDEESDYDDAGRKCLPNQVCGHYLQVVHMAVTKVGCGHNPQSSWVCNYDTFGARKVQGGTYQEPYRKNMSVAAQNAKVGDEVKIKSKCYDFATAKFSDCEKCVKIETMTAAGFHWELVDPTSTSSGGPESLNSIVDVCGKGQQAATSAEPVDISVGGDNSVWTTSGKQIGKYDGNDWIDVPGSAVRIDVADDGTPWIIDSQNKVKKLSNLADPANADWSQEWTFGLPEASDLAVYDNTEIWILTTRHSNRSGGMTIDCGDYQIFRIQDSGASGWSRKWIPGGGVAIDLDKDGIPWVVTAGGEVYSRTAPHEGWERADNAPPAQETPAAQDIAFPVKDDMNRAYILGRDGQVYERHYLSDSWSPFNSRMPEENPSKSSIVGTTYTKPNPGSRIAAGSLTGVGFSVPFIIEPGGQVHVFSSWDRNKPFGFIALPSK